MSLLGVRKILSYAGHTTVNVLRASPSLDEPVVKSNADGAAATDSDMIAVRGADGGLDFGLHVSRTRPETIFDATLYRVVNTTFTGAQRVNTPISCRGDRALAVRALHIMIDTAQQPRKHPSTLV